VNDLFGIDMSFDHGVKVWSDQFSLMMSVISGEERGQNLQNK